MIVDNADIKVVEAKYKEKPFLVAVGTSTQSEIDASGKGSIDGVEGKYKTAKELQWKVMYNPNVLPEFIPIENAKNLMAGTIAVSSGSAAVYNPDTTYVKKENSFSSGSRWVQDIIHNEVAEAMRKLKEKKVETNDQ